jgi:uncharacterized protein
MNLSKHLIEASSHLTELVRKKYKSLAFVAWLRVAVDESPKLVFGFESKEQHSLRSWYEAILRCHQEIDQSHQKALSMLQITVVTTLDRQFRTLLTKIEMPRNVYAKTTADVSNENLNLPETTELLVLYKKRTGREGHPASDSKLKIQLMRTTSGSYYFSIVAPNGQIVLLSGTYASKSGALNAIASFNKNAKNENSYEILMTASGEPYFILKARNGAVLAQSGIYPNELTTTK